MKPFILILLVATLGGCATNIGSAALEKETTGSIGSKLVKGQTTKDDVLRMFGQPYSTVRKGDNEGWSYIGLDTSNPFVLSGMRQAFGGNRGTGLDVVFNAAGVIEDYRFKTY